MKRGAGKGVVRFWQREMVFVTMASYDNYCKIDGEGAFVYGMLRHFTYVAGVCHFFFQIFFSYFALHSSVLPMIVRGIWDWQAEEAAKGRKNLSWGGA